MIGFAENLVSFVENGEKTLTYRVGVKYTNLKKGEKVQVKNSLTGKAFGIVEIINKQMTTFGDLPIERLGHERYGSKEEMRKVFQKYYQRKIVDSDPVVVLEFKLS